MGLFFLILGGALVGLGLLQCGAYVLMVVTWARGWSNRAHARLMMLLLPVILSFQFLQRLQRRIYPRWHNVAPWFPLWGLGGIFLLLGLALKLLLG